MGAANAAPMWRKDRPQRRHSGEFGGQPTPKLHHAVGHDRAKLRDALRGIGTWTIEIIKRSDKAKGFELLPRRWVVERTLARRRAGFQ